jgi:rSAM/selenodomain-associated transferase 1
MRRCLIIVAKEPVAGLVKTRLAASIGSERAAELYRCFLYDTIALAHQVPMCTLALSFWPPASASRFCELDPTALLLPQHGVDFGSRLLSAFEQAAEAGYDEMVLIGSDNPNLPLGYVTQAFAALDVASAVLGPSEDGGYYLIGMRAPQPALFDRGIAWSTALVAQQTYAAAAAAGLSMARVPPWYDIDTMADLQRLYRDLRSIRRGAAPRTLAQLDALARDGLHDLLGEALLENHATH